MSLKAERNCSESRRNRKRRGRRHHLVEHSLPGGNPGLHRSSLLRTFSQHAPEEGIQLQACLAAEAGSGRTEQRRPRHPSRTKLVISTTPTAETPLSGCFCL
jgi:hypothetical protein